ncbi:MAG: hypothetical protein KDJ90_00520 [Nitratireductor sp.]|nr:hypothetical protein [Nitratireductor sp.]
MTQDEIELRRFVLVLAVALDRRGVLSLELLDRWLEAAGSGANAMLFNAELVREYLAFTVPE